MWWGKHKLAYSKTKDGCGFEKKNCYIPNWENCANTHSGGKECQPAYSFRVQKRI